ncbi:MAG TPA: GNAT family N-acetyltransferase [Flavisolibacter sp.]
MHKVRKATESDFPSILSLIREFAAFQGTPGKVTITPEQMLRDRDIFQCMVAESDEGHIVGIATYFFAYYSWSGRAVYLDDLYVQPGSRKQGIGKKLLEAVIGLAKQEHCRKVRWQVSRWNSAAINFYKSMGAVIDDVEMNCDFEIMPV